MRLCALGVNLSERYSLGLLWGREGCQCLGYLRGVFLWVLRLEAYVNDPIEL